MRDGEIDLTHILFGGKVLLHLRGYVNSQNKRYWSAGSFCSSVNCDYITLKLLDGVL